MLRRSFLTSAAVTLLAAPLSPALAEPAGPRAWLLDVGKDFRPKPSAPSASGTLVWSKGPADEMGAPTLHATTSFPDRGVSLDFLLRHNADKSLPASSIVELQFSTREAAPIVGELHAIGLKNDQFGAATPLVGASARVVGNSFLLALSGAASDVPVNDRLLRGRGWLDIAFRYSDKRKAVATLEIDRPAQQLIRAVLDSWTA